MLDPESDKDVTPGSGEVGVLALGGRNPVGYYKDPEKSASTFKEIDGVRYSVPGDFATVDADGAIHLLGRGSVVINTGGEKVFPEEVEEVLKLHPAVADAVAVAIPDDRFGQVVAAVGRAAARGLGHRSRAHRARAGTPGRLQGPQARPFRRDHRTVAGRQGGLRPAPGRDHRVGCGPELNDTSAPRPLPLDAVAQWPVRNAAAGVVRRRC